MQNAFLAGLLVSVACGVIGSLVVINKMTFMAGGVAHGAFGGVGAAFFFGFAPLFGAGVAAVVLGVLIAFISLRSPFRIDNVVGALWAFGMALGIVLADLTPGYNVDLMSYLFGSILAVPSRDLYFMCALDVLFVGFAGVFYRQICATSFDPEFARLRGVKVRALYYATSVLVALCVVASIRVVGLILVIALLTIPPYVAEKFSANLGMMMTLGAVFAGVFCVSGLMLAYFFDLTGGASIILVATTCFFISLLKK